MDWMTGSLSARDQPEIWGVRFMKKGMSWMLAGGLVLWFAALAGQGQPEPRINTKDVMKFKLYYAQRVLEGITMENFDLINTNAQKLASLSQAADWQVRQTPEYQKFTMDYSRHAKALSKAAQGRNVDAATVAYFQLTVSCVNCHRYLRGAGTAENESTSPKLPFVQGREPKPQNLPAAIIATAR